MACRPTPHRSCEGSNGDRLCRPQQRPARWDVAAAQHQQAHAQRRPQCAQHAADGPQQAQQRQLPNKPPAGGKGGAHWATGWPAAQVRIAALLTAVFRSPEEPPRGRRRRKAVQGGDGQGEAPQGGAVLERPRQNLQRPHRACRRQHGLARGAGGWESVCRGTAAVPAAGRAGSAGAAGPAAR